MTLHIDTDDLERLGLDMRELWVLTALRVLSSHKPWKGTYEDLKTKSQCGSKSSAQRIVEVLKEKGWVIETDEGFTVSFQIGTKPSQNGTESSQNRTESSQNRTNSKEKEKNQKKTEKSKLKESVNSNNISPSPTNMKKENNFIPPTWNEWWVFAKEKQMGQFEAQKSFSYYEMRGWKDISNWKAALVYWDLKNKT